MQRTKRIFCSSNDRVDETRDLSCAVAKGSGASVTESFAKPPDKSPYNFDDDFDEPLVRPKIRKGMSGQRLVMPSAGQPEACEGPAAAVAPSENEMLKDHASKSTSESEDQHSCGDCKGETRTEHFHVSTVSASNENFSATAAQCSTSDRPLSEDNTKLECVDSHNLVTSGSEALECGSDAHAGKVSGALTVSECSARVVYVYSQQMVDLCNQLPRIPMRAVMVHSLIEALGLLKKLVVLPPKQIDTEQLLQFHSADYIEFLQKVNHQEDEEKVNEEDTEQYGLTYDCPVQDNVFDCATLVAGATVTAAQSLCEGICNVAINWCGGWHHAQRSAASGFCYINDIALGILKLREKFSRILYVDLDLHHGDGVENAFCTTSHVMTVSFHKYAPGFFPGSGSLSDVGFGKGKYYTVNVPLHDGINDAEYFSIFKNVLTSVQETYNPEAVVCQCGADGLAGDSMSAFNLSSQSYIHCVRFLLDWHLPTLLLGGGGYHHANTARCWTGLTALCVGCRLPQDVPDHKYFTDYGPDYEMHVKAGNRKDHNSSDYLMDVCRTVTENLQKLQNSRPQTA